MPQQLQGKTQIYKKQQRVRQTEREQGVGGGVKKKTKKEETMSTFISSVIPHQWRHAAILIKTKNIHRYRHIGGKLACLKSSEAIKDK